MLKALKIFTVIFIVDFLVGALVFVLPSSMIGILADSSWGYLLMDNSLISLSKSSLIFAFSVTFHYYLVVWGLKLFDTTKTTTQTPVQS